MIAISPASLHRVQHDRPGIRRVETVAAFPDDQTAGLLSPGRRIDTPKLLECGSHAINREDAILPARYDHHGPRREKAKDIGHVGHLQDARHVVVRAVIDGAY
jgi:hypothetical protein